jgi:hypothetical protein
VEPVKIGQILRCAKCGVELRVIKDCDSTCACSIVCCGQPMTVKESQEEEEAAKQ